METYLLQPDQPSPLPARLRAVALGVFDGVHIGHRMVIHRVVGRCAPHGLFHPLSACVLDFAQPVWQIKPGSATLCSANVRDHVLEALGVQERIDLDFDAVRDLSPEAFVRDILQQTLHACYVCCGENYRFGRGGAGTASLLRTLCAPLGIEVEIVPPLMADGEPVSSSRIRACIAAGDMRQASRLLGHPFILDGIVEHGRHLGHTLGAPTLNQPLPEHFAQPRFGVYASCVILNKKIYYAVTNIGVHPTAGAGVPQAETYIPDIDADLYGRSIRVMPIRYLRPEQSFASLEELRGQIARDREQAKRIKEPSDRAIRAVLFDFDDTLQDFHLVFPLYADWFLRRRFPELSAEERDRRVRFMQENNNHGYIEWQSYIRLLVAEWHWTDLPPVEDLIAEFCIKNAEFICMRPGAVTLLQTLRERGYLLGLVTNGRKVLQNRKLDVCALRPYFDTIVVSGSEDVHKPDAELFRRAAMRLGVPCENCLFVGDHPLNDIEGALGAGMQAAYLRTDWERDPVGTYYTVDTLEELLPLLPPRKENDR